MDAAFFLPKTMNRILQQSSSLHLPRTQQPHIKSKHIST